MRNLRYLRRAPEIARRDVHCVCAAMCVFPWGVQHREENAHAHAGHAKDNLDSIEGYGGRLALTLKDWGVLIYRDMGGIRVVR